ncbi:MAG: hypothetical protein N2487_03255, partial [Verrucomicrobiae bacterium]|nr:hypothetical protein [Verrucomicrobiae bacterium]
FYGCGLLGRVYFIGDAPVACGDSFYSTPSTIYYLSGTYGWNTTYCGRPTALWTPSISTITPLYNHSTNLFGLRIIGDVGIKIEISVKTNLTVGSWETIHKTNLTSNVLDFYDPNTNKYQMRFYKVIGY